MNPPQVPDVPLTPEGIDGVAWNVLGQVYLPKEVGPDRFVWYAIFPEETFVPPHTHAAQDEYLMPLDGPIDIVVGGRRGVVQPREVAHLPRGIPHAFFNNSGKPVHALFWATPAGDLPALYRRLHNVGGPAKAVAIAPSYGVVFEPPVSSSA